MNPNSVLQSGTNFIFTIVEKNLGRHRHGPLQYRRNLLEIPDRSDDGWHESVRAETNSIDFYKDLYYNRPLGVDPTKLFFFPNEEFFLFRW